MIKEPNFILNSRLSKFTGKTLIWNFQRRSLNVTYLIKTDIAFYIILKIWRPITNASKKPRQVITIKIS